MKSLCMNLLKDLRSLGLMELVMRFTSTDPLSVLQQLLNSSTDYIAQNRRRRSSKITEMEENCCKLYYISVYLLCCCITIPADKFRVRWTSNFDIYMERCPSASQLRNGHSINRIFLSQLINAKMYGILNEIETV